MISGAMALALFGASIQQAEAIMGECKNVELEFHNKTSGNITIPQSGHRLKNPGGVEGWNKLTLGMAKTDLAAGAMWSETLKLNIKCVDDAEFEIKWSDQTGDHTTVAKNINIDDKDAHFDLK